MSAAMRKQRRTISYAEDDDEEAGDSRSRRPAPISDASYVEGPAPGMESSKSSLGKRLASCAGFRDEDQPKDFEFLFHQLPGGAPGATADAWGSEQGARGQGELGASSRSTPRSAKVRKAECPDTVEDDDVLWVRTDIKRASDLIDGQAWIAGFREHLAQAEGHCEPRALRAESAAHGLGVRNRALKEMGRVSPPGRLVRLSTGQEVIFWFNVGAPGPLQKRVHVTESRCPHQNVCLLGGELCEMEDAAGIASAMIRCPRHHKAFDLHSGSSPGNVHALKPYPCRFMHGFWYVGVDGDSLPATPPRRVGAAADLATGAKLRAVAHSPCGGPEHDEGPSGDAVRKELRLEWGSCA